MPPHSSRQPGTCRGASPNTNWSAIIGRAAGGDSNGGLADTRATRATFALDHTSV